MEHKCKGCVWGTKLHERKVFCLFPKCIFGEDIDMPVKPLKPCSHPGCPNLTAGQYCKMHEVQPDPRLSAEEREYGSKWRIARKLYLSKNPFCVECYKRGRAIKATTVDHKIPHKGNKALFWDENNWQSMCKPCHDRKTAKEDGRWRKKQYTY